MVDEVKSSVTSFSGLRHCRFGLGTAAFVPSLTKFKFSYDELVAHYDMEMMFGQQCEDDKIRIYSPKRGRNWITFIKNTAPNCAIDKHALHMNNVAQRIRRTLNHMNSLKKQKGNSQNDALKPKNSVTLMFKYWHG